MKSADDGGGMVVRLVETHAARGVARLVLERPPVSAHRCDLGERPVEELTVHGREVVVPFGPHQVTTVRLRWDSMTEPWIQEVVARSGPSGLEHGRGLDALPYGVFSAGTSVPRVGVLVGDHVLDLTAASIYLLPQRAALLAGPALDPLLAAGPPVWAEVRAAVQEGLSEPRHRAAVEQHLVPESTIQNRLPFTVADYVDFYPPNSTR